MLPHRVREMSRKELERERDDILARETEWDARIREAGKRGIEDFIVPPIGCCGIYFALFVAGSLILSAISKAAAKQYGTSVAAIAIISALIGVVLIIWRRENRRQNRLLMLERERHSDRELREERLSEINARLESISPPDA